MASQCVSYGLGWCHHNVFLKLGRRHSDRVNHKLTNHSTFHKIVIKWQLKYHQTVTREFSDTIYIFSFLLPMKKMKDLSHPWSRNREKHTIFNKRRIWKTLRGSELKKTMKRILTVWTKSWTSFCGIFLTPTPTLLFNNMNRNYFH